jgi:hypothetical protein
MVSLQIEIDSRVVHLMKMTTFPLGRAEKSRRRYCHLCESLIVPALRGPIRANGYLKLQVRVRIGT